MNEVFLDTVGLIAVWDRDDQWHARADGVYQKLLSDGRRLFTTEMVLMECGNAVSRRPYRRRIRELRQSLTEEGLVATPTVEEIEEAWASYDRGEANEAGIVDQISFQVMRRLGVTEAFTNDQHFRAAGFSLLF
jgi:predicted nucleic acid-binding protein